MWSPSKSGALNGHSTCEHRVEALVEEEASLDAEEAALHLAFGVTTAVDTPAGKYFTYLRLKYESED